jgi:hypothetical protein
LPTRLRFIAAGLAVVSAISSFCVRVEAQSGASRAQEPYSRPAQATRCDVSIPLQISLTPQNEPRAGSTARFSVSIESGIDPDLVRRLWVEYEIPERIRPTREFSENREVPRLTRTSRQELELPLADEGRYRIRARLVVELVSGQTISKTATRWINPRNALPEGVIGRIVDPDGSGIRVYQGVKVRN